MFAPVLYESLNARQKEAYNFHMVAARLAECGFDSMRLGNDWEGADFIAVHIDGQTFLRIQLKSRLTVDRKYSGKQIHIAFIQDGACYVYPHDAFLETLIGRGAMTEASRLWRDEGRRSWPRPPAWALAFLQDFRVGLR